MVHSCLHVKQVVLPAHFLQRLKTVRFNRGYGSKGRPPKQMQWEVKGIVLMDCNENECDPYNVPDDFWPVTIAVKLGKRIG